ncbi:TMEM196 [Mytilus coruscus]|uniref:Transmembrane protein 196 n=1 Tax=Mytilus coruscus TaxID=42192 RepID=A0A6J8BYK6_MYTCO|nr:unnamed protein product [Mytilus coruscus]CAC5388763.1 TMEM196 [Mytilus coruscus]
MLRAVLTAVYIISGVHIFLGILSVCLGVVSSIRSEFIITGIIGILCAKRKSSYVIMSFIALSVVSIVTAVVSIQLLRLGLVNHTTDGHTFQKENKDILILIALAVAGTECLVCILSSILSCRVAKIAKEEMFKQREGMFYVKDDSNEVNDEVRSQIDTEETMCTEETTETTDFHVEVKSQFFYNDAFINDEENNFVFISD